MSLALTLLHVHSYITSLTSLVTQLLINSLSPIINSFIHILLTHCFKPSPGLDEMLVSKDATILQLQQELLLLQQSLDIAKASQTTMKKEIDDRKSTASEDVARWCDTRSASSFLCLVS